MNKRSLFLTACCIALYAGVCMAQDFAGGSGTETDPYLIKTPQQLSNLRNYLDEYPKKYFKLGNDLDVSAFCQESWGTAGWEPVGRERTPFGGQLDGDGHKISGLWIDRETEDNIGLFGSISGTVKNLGIATDDTRGGIKGRSYVGSLAGQNSGEIVNCHAAALINGNGGDYGDYSGGLIGYVSGNGSVTNCYASGDVSASDSYSYAGGLIGSVHEGSITNCYASGNVSSLYCSGGLIGHVSEGNTTNCYATGDVFASYSSYNASYSGGLIGGNGGSVTNCYAAGKATATEGRTSYLGSLIGYNEGPILSCYFLKESGIDGIGVDDANNSKASGLTAEQMESRSSFAGFDFNAVWAIHEDWTYPYLQGVGSDRPGSPAGTIPVLSETTLQLIITDGTLHIGGLTIGERIGVYNMLGQLLFSGRASSDEQTVSLATQGVYIVTAGERSAKVAY